MKDIILIGSGGCMRELLWQIEEYNHIKKEWNVLGYVDSQPCEHIIDVGNGSCPYLGDDDYLLKITDDRNVIICVGDSLLRKKIAKKLKKNRYLHFPNLILSDTQICSNVCMGEGCIISMNSILSTEVILGSFVFLNIGVTVCHQGRIGDYATLSPYVKLAGNVNVGEGCYIGMGTNIIQGIRVGNQSVIGAGSVVIHDVESNCTVAGVPTKFLHSN